ncbi:MAG TPA: hypothetical protein VEV38_07485 [Candidatus Eremiobacteraceae bacterium]|nr:hypothetical protein [Candidatus Eremiobacteraceae bacterium]
METLAAVVVTRNPDPDECARVLTPILMTQRGVVIYRALCGALGLLFVGFGVLIMTGPSPDFVFGPIMVGFGLIVGLLPPVVIRANLARRIIASVKLALQNNEVLTVSDAGLDIATAHTSSHIDWQGFKSARRIAEGLLFQVGIRTVFVGSREFDSGDDFERAILLFKNGLGTNFLEGSH